MLPTPPPPLFHRGRPPMNPERHLRLADEAADMARVSRLELDEWLCAGIVEGVWDEQSGWWTTVLAIRQHQALAGAQ